MDPHAILMEFELNERQVVEAAARTRTTVQQAPAIVTVITSAEIRDRGYRTVSDALCAVPGFECDRWEFNGWYKDNLTRGNPRTALVLLDGVNIVEPMRNLVSLDRRIPLDNVRRIEVTSGPGSVLWGSNALLGVINIITHDGRSKPGVEVRAGGGGGPGEQAAARAHASFGGTWLNDLVRAYIGTTYFTSEGPRLTVDQDKLLGPFPSPAPDGLTLFVPGGASSPVFGRDHTLDVTGNLGIGPVTIGWSTGFDLANRELGSGGGVLTLDHRTTAGGDSRLDRLQTKAEGRVHTLYARYGDRFLGEALGVSAQGHFVSWQLDEDPFGVFPRFDLLPQGGTTTLRSEGIYRTGLNLDVDAMLPFDNHLLIGAEVFGDLSRDLVLTTFDPRATSAATTCAAPFELHPERDAARPCSVTEIAIPSTRRVIGGVYATDEWRVGERLALNFGLRGQLSSTYDPALLISSGLVVGLDDDVFVKATYGEGFRPPDFQSTSASDSESTIANALKFEPNPSLDVERSRAVEVEVNARLFENVRPIKQLYLRADYSYTRLSGIITFPAQRYENSGDRHIHSVELLSKLHFTGDHELWLSYYFVDVVDSEIGRLPNIANHILSAGGRLSLFGGHLQLASVLTVRGQMKDLNRTAAQPSATPLLTGLVPSAKEVAPTGVEVTDIPTAALLRVGVEGRKIFGFLDVSAWVYNVLNTQYEDPDWFYDDRIMSRPQPKPGVSFFFEAGATF